MNIPKHVLNCPWVGQQHDILSFCKHLILRLWSIFSQNDNSALGGPQNEICGVFSTGEVVTRSNEGLKKVLKSSAENRHFGG